MPVPTKIVTYVASMHDDAPEGQRCMARIFFLLKGKWELQVICAYGPDKQTARAKMEAWWASEVEKARKREAAVEARAEARRRPVAEVAHA